MPEAPLSWRYQETTMKIVLDLTRLVREGKLSAEQAEQLQVLASRDTGSLAINILMPFGAIAVAVGILALKPPFATGAAAGGVIGVFRLAPPCPLGGAMALTAGPDPDYR